MEVFNQAVAPLVLDVCNGLHAALLLYGGTGTGKSYTAEGAVEDVEGQGAIPRAASLIWAAMAERGVHDFTVTVSLLGVDNEVLEDLFVPSGGTSEERLVLMEVRACVQPVDVLVPRTPSTRHPADLSPGPGSECVRGCCGFPRCCCCPGFVWRHLLPELVRGVCDQSWASDRPAAGSQRASTRVHDPLSRHGVPDSPQSPPCVPADGMLPCPARVSTVYSGSTHSFSLPLPMTLCWLCVQLEYMLEGLRKVGRFTCVDVCGSHDASLHGLNRLIAALARGDPRIPYRYVAETCTGCYSCRSGRCELVLML